MVFGPLIWLLPVPNESPADREGLEHELPQAALPEIVSGKGIRTVGFFTLVLFFAAFSIYRRMTLGERWQLFENTGHLRKIPDTEEYGYAILSGDGSFLKKEAGQIVLERFECEEKRPSLSGQPDRRRICRYEPIDLSDTAQQLPPGLR